MSNSLLGISNFVKTGGLIAGSEAVGLNVGNLQNDHGAPQLAWQTAAGVVSSAAGAWFSIDSMSVLTAWTMCGVFRSNMTMDAIIRIRVADSLVNGQVAGTPVFDSGSIPAGIVARYWQSVLILPAGVIGRYCQFDFDDPGNPNGFINIPQAYAGGGFSPRIGRSWDSSQSRNHQTNIQVSRGGQQYAQPQWIQRSYNLVLASISDSEVWSDLDEIDRQSRLGGNVLFVPDVTSPNLQREALFGMLTPSAPIDYAAHNVDSRGWSATITERL